jgi:hypothetical protein
MSTTKRSKPAKPKTKAKPRAKKPVTPVKPKAKAKAGNKTARSRKPTPPKKPKTRAKPKANKVNTPPPAPLGNQHWRLRSSHGPPTKFAGPIELWNACFLYFKWAEDNPVLEEKIFTYEGATHTGAVNKSRAMTIQGLCNYIGIDRTTWYEYRKRPDLSPVTEQVDDTLYDQKFAGAASGVFNANIIARDLGLADKTTSEITGEGGGPVTTITREMSDKEALRYYKEQIRPDKR